MRCQTTHLTISISSGLGQKSPVMASGGDHGKCPCGGSPYHNGCQPPSHRARMDASSSRASPLVRWGFTLCRRLHGLATCHDNGLWLLIGVGLHLHQMRWPLSCRGSSLPRRGSWIVGRMIWWLLSAPMERCVQNVMLVMSELRLSSRTSLLAHQPQPNIG
jgi:hypothetical protein